MAMNKRSQSRLKVLQCEGHEAASHAALSKQGRQAAKKRSSSNRQQSAMKAVQTKGRERLQQAARKAAATRKKAA